MLFGWFGRKRRANITNQWFAVVDEASPDIEDPALLVHVVDLKAGDCPSIARRSNQWTTNPSTVDYFTRTGRDPGVRPLSRAQAGDVARLWGAAWPPPSDTRD